ncbi:MAG: hypothetical protein R3F40_07410 [Candidatus Competibacteraceae bacterium]
MKFVARAALASAASQYHQVLNRAGGVGSARSKCAIARQRTGCSVAPSRIGLRAGEMVTMQDLMYGLLLKSGNDAAETLAEAAGGSVYQFAGLMNAKAWQIGARNSHFTNHAVCPTTIITPPSMIWHWFFAGRCTITVFGHRAHQYRRFAH